MSWSRMGILVHPNAVRGVFEASSRAGSGAVAWVEGEGVLASELNSSLTLVATDQDPVEKHQQIEL